MNNFVTELLNVGEQPAPVVGAAQVVEQRRQHGQTVLFTSHQWCDVERLADRVAVLVEGRLVADLSQRGLSERLAARGVLRLRLDACPEALRARVVAGTLKPPANQQELDAF